MLKYKTFKVHLKGVLRCWKRDNHIVKSEAMSSPNTPPPKNNRFLGNFQDNGVSDRRKVTNVF